MNNSEVMLRLPRVDIIVLNWNGLRDTLHCLQSLKRADYPAFRVLVVDNGSSDASSTSIRQRFPEVTLIENSENLGFTGGNNIGMRQALEEEADYVLLLNNDTEVAPDAVRLLVETAESDPRIGIAGPIIYYYDRPKMIWEACLAGAGLNDRS
jgi:GT2 family glycosyltransferase